MYKAQSFLSKKIRYGETRVIWDKADFTAKLTTRDKKRQYVVIIGSVHRKTHNPKRICTK